MKTSGLWSILTVSLTGSSVTNTEGEHKEACENRLQWCLLLPKGLNIFV